MNIQIFGWTFQVPLYIKPKSLGELTHSDSKELSYIYIYGTVRSIVLPGFEEKHPRSWPACWLAGAAWRACGLAGWPDACQRPVRRLTAGLNYELAYRHPTCWLAEGQLAGHCWLPTWSTSSVAWLFTEFLFLPGFSLNRAVLALLSAAVVALDGRPVPSSW